MPIISRPYRKIRLGYCPICEKPTIFSSKTTWLRDDYLCRRCSSIPRFRAVIDVLQEHFPDWRELRVHESSPGGAGSVKISRECRQYVGTYYFPDVPEGTVTRGFRSENLEQQTFPDGSFDLVVTQDVFEHVLHPDRGFREIARTLKPGGAHVFTVPWYYWQRTVVRAEEQDGKIVHLLPAEYHGNPINTSGSLVIREWGYDLPDFILRTSGMSTAAIRMRDPGKGIEAKFIEVFVSTKAS